MGGAPEKAFKQEKKKFQTRRSEYNYSFPVTQVCTSHVLWEWD